MLSGALAVNVLIDNGLREVCYAHPGSGPGWHVDLWMLNFHKYVGLRIK